MNTHLMTMLEHTITRCIMALHMWDMCGSHRQHACMPGVGMACHHPYILLTGEHSVPGPADSQSQAHNSITCWGCIELTFKHQARGPEASNLGCHSEPHQHITQHPIIQWVGFHDAYHLTSYLYIGATVNCREGTDRTQAVHNKTTSTPWLCRQSWQDGQHWLLLHYCDSVIPPMSWHHMSSDNVVIEYMFLELMSNDLNKCVPRAYPSLGVCF